MADKAPEAFRTISEVADLLETPAHVLRFWESKFSQVKPVKRAGGRRYYRPADVALLAGIKRLLHDDGMTIRGVQKLMREHGARHVADMGRLMEADVEATLAPETGEPETGAFATEVPAGGAPETGKPEAEAPSPVAASPVSAGAEALRAPARDVAPAAPDAEAARAAAPQRPGTDAEGMALAEVTQAPATAAVTAPNATEGTSSPTEAPAAGRPDPDAPGREAPLTQASGREAPRTDAPKTAGAERNSAGTGPDAVEPPRAETAGADAASEAAGSAPAARAASDDRAAETTDTGAGIPQSSPDLASPDLPPPAQGGAASAAERRQAAGGRDTAPRAAETAMADLFAGLDTADAESLLPEVADDAALTRPALAAAEADDGGDDDGDGRRVATLLRGLEGPLAPSRAAAARGLGGRLAALHARMSERAAGARL